MMNTNWLWFRVFANLALASNGARYSKERLEADLNHLDTFYRGEGWSNDGPGTYTQMDYYSGSFAIQFAQLLYAKTAADRDPERAESYKERARLYAQQFVHYFDEEGMVFKKQLSDLAHMISGRAIAFGRSLTYRFAMAGFWSAIAFAEVELPAPLTWGVVKGLLLRNLRWWSKQSEILTPQGTLSIGYAYPNQFMTENYNSPGSPYWFMLGFAALALPSTHPFWTANEEAYPSQSLPQVVALERPMHIAVNRGGHRFILSSGQLCHYAVRAAESKYGKFAYSSAFGYSVPTGSYNLESIGHDNMLALSDDQSETWKQRKLPMNVKSSHFETIDGSPVLVSDWKPWSGVKIESFLIPPTGEAPNWHLRVHHIVTDRDLNTSEGAFAIHGIRASDGRKLEALDAVSNEGQKALGAEAIAASEAGSVGIVELLRTDVRLGAVLAADANANLMSKRAVLPALSLDIAADTDIWVCTAVFAMPSSAASWEKEWRKAWDVRPVIPKWVAELVKGVPPPA